MTDISIRRKRLVVSFLLSIFSFPLFFTRSPDDNIDGSWIRALNLAIRNKLVFGVDFVYTYGPLGFLNTRNAEFVNTCSIFIGDVFLFIGFFYFVYKYIAPVKDVAWFLITLISFIILRDAHYSQSVFLIFIISAIALLKSAFTSYFDLFYTAAAGVLLFFIKINYGIIPIAILALLLLLLLIKDTKKALLFFTSSALIFFCIYSCSHINIRDYFSNSIILYKYYDEAVYYHMSPFSPVYMAAIALLLLQLYIIMSYFITAIKHGALNILQVAQVVILAPVSFILFRNGFTRADDIHYVEFFFAYPMLILATIFLFDFNKTTKKIASIALVLSFIIVFIPKIMQGAVSLRQLTPIAYFTDIFQKPKDYNAPQLQLDDDCLKILGKSTIDIFPDEIALIHYNKLNYAPRPVPQSYSVYSTTLDSLNAVHFSNKTRPEFVLLKMGHFDNGYGPWDESLTKTTILLNYTCTDTIIKDHLLLKSTNKQGTWPEFKELGRQAANITDTIPVTNADSSLIYICADIKYNAAAKVLRLIYGAPALDIVFFLDDGTSYEYEAICPNLKTPMIINKFVSDNNDLKNLLTNKLNKCRNIKAFAFHPLNPGFDQKCTLSFYKLTNSH